MFWVGIAYCMWALFVLLIAARVRREAGGTLANAKSTLAQAKHLADLGERLFDDTKAMCAKERQRRCGS
jgi:hypothetical protein